MIVLTLTIGRCLNNNIFWKGDGFITVEGVIIVLGTTWVSVVLLPELGRLILKERSVAYDVVCF